jgi:hypothetical protein
MGHHRWETTEIKEVIARNTLSCGINVVPCHKEINQKLSDQDKTKHLQKSW